MDANALWQACAGDGPAVMAIVNATTDSFYAGSRLGLVRRRIISRIEHAVGEGARILDVGGYSTRPFAEPVGEEDELMAVCTAMRVMRRRFPHVAVSLDTFRASVARQVMDEFGPCIVNDISAGEADPGMLPLVAERGVPYIAMHMRGTPETMAALTDYGGDVAGAVVDYLGRKLEILRGMGIDKVILDPGFGFAKTVRQNHELLAAMPRLAALGVPVLAGLSRKSMRYKVTGGGPADALAGTAALNWQALGGGAKILRVHDVRAAVDVVKLFEYYNGKDE